MGSPSPPPRGHDFDDLFRRDYASIVSAVRPIVGDHQQSEAIAQDAFLAAVRRWRRVSRYDKPGAWVRRVAIRDAVRFARRNARSVPLSDTAAADGSARQDDAADIDRAVRALPSQQRAAVSLYYFADWPTDEIAVALDCSAATVRVHLHRARATLAERSALDPDPEEIS